MGKTALVIGGTGLVGKNLVQLLLNSEEYKLIHVFVRRTTGVKHPKLEEYIIDFAEPDLWKAKVKGDILFSALGTTIAKAGTKKRQYEIDYTYQYNFASIAAENGVQEYVLVSAQTAKSSSSVFYSQMKGQLEDAVSKLAFSRIILIRPGLLYGDRAEKRLWEGFGLKIFKGLNKLGILKKYRPISGKEVAQAMLQSLSISRNEAPIKYTGKDLFALSYAYSINNKTKVM